MKRTIKKVAVLGSGVMGSRIACHFAGVGLQVLLLDIPAGEGTGNGADKNKIVNDALAAALKSNPSPVYTKSVVKRIKTGNFEDHLPEIQGCDWIIEVVVERLDIKQQLFEQAARIFLILPVTYAYSKLFLHSIRILRSSIFYCITAMCIWERQPCCVKIRPHLLQTGLVCLE
jgi:hypothetical protein